jgi:hypothetical protein
MPAVPLKREYGPTLGEILAPRWRRASPVTRGLWLATLALAVAVLAGAALTLASPTISVGGPAPFSFSYGGLYRTSPGPGWYTKVWRVEGGHLEDSFAVGPLTLPSYRGELGAALALYATREIPHLAAGASALRGVALRGEGKTQIDSVSDYATYNIFYTATLEGREMYGREILLLPERPGARRGVTISMLTAAAGNHQVTSPLDVGIKGALEEPLSTFALE